MKARFSAMWSDKLGAAILNAANQQCPDGFPMEFRYGADFRALQQAVDQGIDSRLEAVMFSEFAGEHGRRGFNVMAESLPCLVRRLLDSDEAGMSLASGICECLDIELI